jgi:signal transduction histidine kinase/DNA-binding response OmpR family regulator/ligand-binding sensor domain-containing protein
LSQVRRLSALILLVFLFLSAEGQQMALSRQMVFQEVSRNDTWVFLEDSHGFVWMGGASLRRTDGYTIEPFEPECSEQMLRIRALAEDARGRIWIGAHEKLFCYEKETHTLDRLFPDYLFRGCIWTIHEDVRGWLWFTDEERVFVVQSPGQEQPTMVEGIFMGPASQRVTGARAIWEDKNGTIWLGGNKGLWSIAQDLSVRQYLPVAHPDFIINDMAAAGADSLWLATSQGLWGFRIPDGAFFKVDLPDPSIKVLKQIKKGREGKYWIGTMTHGVLKWENGRFEVFNSDSDNAHSILDNHVMALLEDRYGNIWVGTMFGVSMANFERQKFPFYQIDPGPRQIDNYAFRVMQDADGGFWFRLLKLGLGYSPGLGEPCRILLQPTPNAPIEEIKHFCLDADGNVWVLTLTKGLYKFPRGKTTWERIPFRKDMEAANTLDILADQKNADFLWFTTKYGLCKVDRHSRQMFLYRPTADLPALETDVLNSLVQDDLGHLWATTRHQNATRIIRFDWRKERFFADFDNGKDPASAVMSRCFHLKNVGGNKIWAGTDNGILVIDAAANTYTRITQTDSLPLKTVASITPDLDGNIWFASGRTICKFDGDTYACHTSNGDIGGFNGASACLGSDGRVTFGGSNGIYSFFPREIDLSFDKVAPPPVCLTGFSVLNKPRKLGKAYELADSITVKYEENILSFEFASPHFLGKEAVTYEYRLKGFSDEWATAKSSGRKAIFTNLRPGRYLFEVRAFHKTWETPEKGLRIALRVLPPWYLAPWAIVLWIALFSGTIYGGYRYQLQRKLALAEAGRLKELDALKSRFFTDISHEFRTPLTVILGNADLLDKTGIKGIKGMAGHIRSSGNALLKLINQLLDLAMLEAGTLKLDLAQGDVVVFARYVLESFHSLAAQKNIRLRFESGREGLLMDYDPDRLQQVLGNLLSNAIKFTPEGGEVVLACSVFGVQFSVGGEGAQRLVLKVSDTGIGISKEHLPHIFDRFYRVDGASALSGEGTGIGLAFTKELVQLMGGTIAAESEPGRGTAFTISLPVSRKAKMSAPVNRAAPEPVKTAVSLPPPLPSGRSRILIIEDNPDVTAYIRQCLAREFDVMAAPDGRAGADRARAEIPDLVISDVMMPEMDGYEVVHALKTDPLTCHIPIVLLTARADLDSRLEGWERGADEYLSKPFNPEELNARIANLLENRRRLQERFRSPESPAVQASYKDIDDPLVRALIEKIEKDLTRQWEAWELAQTLRVQENQLYRKLKSVTNRHITDFVRYVRLENSRRLLLEKPNETVAVIAYDVGFGSPQEFSRKFKEEYGCTPGQWRRR